MRRALPVLEVRIAHGELLVAWIAHADRDQAIGIHDRQASQDYSVDDGDQAGCGSDTKREREGSNNGEPAIACQQREGVSNILQHAHTLPEQGVKVP